MLETSWLVGILGYWWVQFLFRGHGSPERMWEQAGDDTPEIKALRSWCTLSEAMTVYGGETNEPEAHWSDTSFWLQHYPRPEAEHLCGSSVRLCWVDRGGR